MADPTAEHGDLTADNVAAAVKHFLTAEGADGETAYPELLLQGVPDERLARLLEAKGGEIRIKIRGVPAELVTAMAEERASPAGRNPYPGGYANSFIPTETK